MEHLLLIRKIYCVGIHIKGRRINLRVSKFNFFPLLLIQLIKSASGFCGTSTVVCV